MRRPLPPFSGEVPYFQSGEMLLCSKIENPVIVVILTPAWETAP